METTSPKGQESNEVVILPEKQLETVITQELIKENITEKVIEELKKSRGLSLKSLDDKEGYNLIYDARIQCKNTRILAQKICKKGREKAVLEQKAWIAKEKEVVAQIEEVENYLLAEEGKYEAEQKRIRDEKLNAERIRLENAQKEKTALRTLRQNNIMKIGAIMDGEYFVLGKSQFPIEYILDASQDDYISMFTTLKGEGETISAAKKLEENRLADEKEAQRLESIRLADEKKLQDAKALELKQQQELIDAENLRLKNEKISLRTSRIKAIVDNDSEIAKDVFEMSDNAFEGFLGKIKQDKEEVAKLEELKNRTEARIAALEEMGAKLENGSYVLTDGSDQGTCILSMEQIETCSEDDFCNKYLPEYATLSISVKEAKQTKEKIAREEAEKLEEQRIEALKPDQQKLQEWMLKLDKIVPADCETEEGKKLANGVFGNLRDLLADLKTNIELLTSTK